MKEPTLNEIAIFLRTWAITFNSVAEEMESGETRFSRRLDIVCMFHDAAEAFKEKENDIAP